MEYAERTQAISETIKKDYLPLIASDKELEEYLKEENNYIEIAEAPFEYTVNAIEGAQKGFSLNANGFWESQNKGIQSSYSLCRIRLKVFKTTNIVFNIINSGESCCDFGIFSKLDTALGLDYNADVSTLIHKSFSGQSSTSIVQLTYENVEAREEEYFIDVKFRKDHSVDKDNDSLQFQIVTPDYLLLPVYKLTDSGEQFIIKTANAKRLSLENFNNSNTIYLEENGEVITNNFSGQNYEIFNYGSLEKWYQANLDGLLTIDLREPSNLYLRTKNKIIEEDIRITPILESIEIDPSSDTQNISPSDNYVGIGSITVTPIPAEYISTEDATAVAEEILSGKTAYVKGQLVTGNIVSKAAEVYTPGLEDQVIEGGVYLEGAQTILGDANLIPENIIVGKSIFGVSGVASGSEASFTYEVNAIQGASYGFSLNSNGYYQSGNKGVHSSYAICRVNLKVNRTADVTFNIINYAESNYDYALFGNLDVALAVSTTADSTVKKSFKGLSSSSVVQLIYEGVEAGEHFIDVKFIKDGSTHSNNDTVQFKIIESDLQSVKSITPTKSTQTLYPDAGYKAMQKVIVNPIPANYVDSNEANATENDILQGKTAYISGFKKAGSIPIKPEAEYIPTTTGQIIEAGTYMGGTQLIQGDVNLRPENIAEGVSIFGVKGQHSGSPIQTEGLIVNGIIHEYLVNAGSVINAGDFVEFITKYGEGIFNSDQVSNLQAYKINNEKILLCYRISKTYYAQIVGLFQDSISFGESFSATVDSTAYAGISACILGEDKIVIGYYTGIIKSFAVEGLSLIKRGNDINLGDAVSKGLALMNLDETRFLVLYGDAADYTLKDQSRARLYTIDESYQKTLITAPTSNTYIQPSAAKLFNISSEKICGMDQKYSNSTYSLIYYSVLVSQNNEITPTTTTLRISDNQSIPYNIQKINSEKFLLIYRKPSSGEVKVQIIATSNGGNLGEEYILTTESSGSCGICVLNENKFLAFYNKNGSIICDLLAYNGNNFSITTTGTISNDTCSQAKILSTSNNSALAFFVKTNGSSEYINIEIENNNIIINNNTNGICVQPATSNSYTMGLALTGGLGGDIVQVYRPEKNLKVLYSLSNCSVLNKPTWIRQNTGSANGVIVPKITYGLPSSIEVSGADYTYDSTSGCFTLGNASDNVSIKAICNFTGKWTSSVKSGSSVTSLTSNISCKTGDLIVAAIATRDTLTLSDGWTLISTSEVNSTDTENRQRLSWAWKIAKNTSESITVTQATAQLMYINMVALQGATGIEDNGYTYVDDTTLTSITATKPSGLVLWGMTAPLWDSTSPYTPWSVSNNTQLIQPSTTSQQRLAIGLDQSENETVTFTPSAASSMIVGCLTVQGMDYFWQ